MPKQSTATMKQISEMIRAAKNLTPEQKEAFIRFFKSLSKQQLRELLGILNGEIGITVLVIIVFRVLSLTGLLHTQHAPNESTFREFLETVLKSIAFYKTLLVDVVQGDIVLNENAEGFAIRLRADVMDIVADILKVKPWLSSEGLTFKEMNHYQHSFKDAFTLLDTGNTTLTQDIDLGQFVITDAAKNALRSLQPYVDRTSASAKSAPLSLIYLVLKVIVAILIFQISFRVIRRILRSIRKRWNRNRQTLQPENPE